MLRPALSLKDPGRYRYVCRADNGWRSVEVDAPDQPLDLSRGGPGPLLHATLDL